ncbi:hypothetical protein RZS08_59395, partial [Arthrospira platensis SPKY1]|nr:hypothetical protein [Arthrospira platensis SPKY1]
RLERFVRRHRVAVGASALAAVAVVGGAVAAVSQARAARAAQRQAAAVSEFVQGIFTRAELGVDTSRALTGRELLEQAVARLDEAFDDRPDDRLSLQLLLAQG